MHHLVFAHQTVRKPGVGSIVLCSRRKWLNWIPWNGDTGHGYNISHRQDGGIWWAPESAIDSWRLIDLSNEPPDRFEQFAVARTEEEAWYALRWQAWQAWDAAQEEGAEGEHG